ncbi:uncharacterized protein LOC136026567 isoform X1 [Artemia franciscana]|uniref:uncharacterized protein LOC136026567 isoform X1 n=1 Tax=Artemia franciscana TaxID=6661 RepID=UPI0032DAEE35
MNSIFRKRASKIIIQDWLWKNLSTVPESNTVLRKYRQYLQSKSRHQSVQQRVKELMFENRLVVLKKDQELSFLIKNSSADELPYLSYLVYKAYDKKLLEAYKQRLEMLEDISNLSLKDVSIMCNTAFTSSLKVNNYILLEKISEKLRLGIEKNNLKMEYIPVVKFLRLSKYYDRDCLDLIHMKVNENCLYMSLTDLCHFVAWLVDSEYYINPLSDEAIGLITEKLDKLSEIESLRIKDVDRLLWILSFHDNVPRNIMEKLSLRICNEVRKEDLGVLLLGNMLLSLAILKFYNRKLLTILCNEGRFREIDNLGSNKSRMLSRLGLFLEATKIEGNFGQDLVRQIEQGSSILKLKRIQEMDISEELKFKKGLAKVYEVADSCSKKLGLRNAKLEIPIPYLNISGVTFDLKTKKNLKVSIEVVDKHTWISRSVYKPGRLLSLKLRLLHHLGWKTILVSELEARTSDEKIYNMLKVRLNQL